eukprot:GCRY01004449.1.p1 GENE.GCRY01004449.1~~GCRY01004449.1.p1  ORF type:complete len:249 (+),score=43.81 GCRY01004449.1:100-846(+)
MSSIRDLMKQKQKQRQFKTTIDSPFARINKLGQLACKLCNSTVKSEHHWASHVLSKQHKQNEAALKLSKTRKPVQAIDNRPQKKPNVSSALPANFFDSAPQPNNTVTPTKPKETKGAAVPKPLKSSLPEGFFDDKVVDNKKRGVVLQKKQEEKDQLEAFQQEVEQELNKQQEIREEKKKVELQSRDEEETSQKASFQKRLEELRNRKKEHQKKVEEIVSNQKEDSSDDGGDSEGEDGILLDTWRMKAI